MKFYALVFLFFSSASFAGSCFDYSWNFKVGLKLTGMMNDLIDSGTPEKRKNLKKFCAQKNELWRDERDAIKSLFLESHEELKRKGDISAERINGGPSYTHLTDNEICGEIKKEIAKEVSCYMPRSYLEEISHDNLLEKEFDEICGKYLPRLEANFKKCREK